jgi:hypothetical protein
MARFMVIILAALLLPFANCPALDAQVGEPSDPSRQGSRVIAKSHSTRAKNRAMNQRAEFVPPKGKCFLIIGQDQNGIDGYPESIARPFAGVMTYTNSRDPGPMDEFK